LLIANSNGYVLRLALTPYRTESTKAGRKFAKPDDGGQVVLVKLISDETGVMLASKGGRVIHFPLDEVNVLAGVGKGVIGIKLQGEDECIGGVLVGMGRFEKLVVETESGKTQDYGITAYPPVGRGGKGEKPGARTNFTRVVPPEIQLVNWDEVEGKHPKPSKNGTHHAA
jgi:DNA gyrase subunit A